MERINNMEELKSLRERLKGSIFNADTKRVRICCGTACSAQGSHKIVQTFEEESALKNMGIEVVKTGCQGLCQKGPVMRTEPSGYFYQRVTHESVREIISKSFSAGVPVRRLLYRESAVDGPI